jgi:hypothetical protein
MRGFFKFTFQIFPFYLEDFFDLASGFSVAPSGFFPFIERVFSFTERIFQFYLTDFFVLASDFSGLLNGFFQFYLADFYVLASGILSFT